MKREAILTVNNRLGLHVRPAALFAQMASGFRSSVSVTKNGCTVNGKSSIELLTLAAVRGSTIVVQVEGPDAECALTHLKSLVESNFGEE